MSLDQHLVPLPTQPPSQFLVLKHDVLFRQMSYLHIHSHRSRSLRLVVLLAPAELPDLWLSFLSVDCACLQQTFHQEHPAVLL